MKTVWKYVLQSDSQIIHMPSGAKILSVQFQYKAPVVWALVDPEMPTEPRKFVAYGTGQPVSEAGQYLGTFQIVNGIVFHVFEVKV